MITTMQEHGYLYIYIPIYIYIYTYIYIYIYIPIYILEVIIYKSYVILLPALDNHILSLFRPFSYLIRPSSAQSGLTFDFSLKYPIKIRNRDN